MGNNIKNKIALQTLPKAPKFIDKSDITYSIDPFINNQASEETKRAYLSEIRMFAKWINKPLESVSFGDVVNYKNYLTEKGLVAITISKKLTVLRQFFKFCKEHYFLRYNPTEGVKLPKVSQETTKEILSLPEAEKLIYQIDTTTLIGKRDLAIIGLMLVNGLRECEISKANIEDLTKINEFNVLKVKGKGGKIGDAKLRDDVFNVIQDYLNARKEAENKDLELASAIFIGVNGKSGERITTRSIRARIDLYLKKTGLKNKNISGHSFRHTAITLTIINGATLIQAQEMARHSDPKVTMRYFHNLNHLQNNGVDLNPIFIASSIA